MRKHSGIGLSIDDHCALEIIDDTYRVITSHEGAGAYKLTKHRGRITVSPIPQSEEYQPLAALLAKPTSGQLSNSSSRTSVL